MRPTDVARPETFWVMAIAAALLYAIACLNAMNLMLVRLLGRRRELRIRLALGATRWQIARLLVIESVGLALAASLIVTLSDAVRMNRPWASTAVTGNTLTHRPPIDNDMAVSGNRALRAKACLQTVIARSPAVAGRRGYPARLRRARLRRGLSTGRAEPELLRRLAGSPRHATRASR